MLIPITVFCYVLTAEFVEGILNSTLHRCCSLGKNRAFGISKCDAKIQTPIPEVPIEHQSICLSANNLCCIQSLRDISCKNGIYTARSNSSCIIHGKTDEDVTYKYCCEVCKLGLISAAMSKCDLKTLKFGLPWDEVHDICCKNVGISINTRNFNEEVSTTETKNMCNLLPNELCSHICIPVGGSYRCQCRSGFTLMADGKSCHEDIGNRCEKNNPCEQNCFDNGLSTVCSCNDGFSLQSDNKSCEDINECTEELHSCNLDSYSCVNIVGGYRCILQEKSKLSLLPSENKTTYISGFTFNKNSNSYEDIDECLDKPCSSHEICQNTIGSFRCDCAIGFRKDKIVGTCVDINECQLNTHNCDVFSQRCDNTIGSYHCVRFTSCGTGYTFNSQSLICEDDDECILGTDNCRILGPDWECRNTLGSFRCEKKRCQNLLNCSRVTYSSCPKGFELNNKGICTDINECKEESICPFGQNCLNIPGSFQCVTPSSTCDNGFRLDDTLTHCIDINECTEQPGICDHYCINTYSSFKCSCKPGFLLHHDNRSCVDINECEYSKNRPLCAAFCINELGTYKCQCPEGYNLGADGASCIDIDECVTEISCNGSNEICLNMQGSYRCNVIVCPSNYIKDTQKKNRCIRAPYFCASNEQGCNKMPLSYSYNYITFVSNVPIPAAGQLELFNMKGSASRTSTIEFTLELKNVLAPAGIPKVTSDYFYVNNISSNQIILSLIKSITGPQDIELHLQMQFKVNGTYYGFITSKLFIFVSKYEF